MTGEAQHFKRPAVTFAGIPAGTFRISASGSFPQRLGNPRQASVFGRPCARQRPV